MAGRGARYTPIQIAAFKERIVDLLEKGSTKSGAAQDVGINPTTLWRWQLEDEEFKAAVNETEIGAQRMIVQDALYKKAVEGHVTAMFGWLNANWPEKYKHPGNSETDPLRIEKVLRTPLRGPELPLPPAPELTKEEPGASDPPA